MISLNSIVVLNNTLKLDEPFKLEIEFSAYRTIEHEVEWELIFVSTDGDGARDQVLDAVVVENVPEGRHKFLFEAPPPELKLLRTEDLMDVTLLLLKCKYNNQLFCQVGWFVTHVYTDPEYVENPPEQPILEKLERCISVDDSRVTTYSIKWNNEEEKPESEGEKSDNEDNINSQGTDNIKNAEMSNVSSNMSQKSELSNQVEISDISIQKDNPSSNISNLEAVMNKSLNLKNATTPLVDTTNN